MKSDIGNLYPFVRRYVDRSPFALSFLADRWTDMEAWREQGRAKLRQLLSYEPEPAMGPAVVRAVAERDGYREEELALPVGGGACAAATLLVPTGAAVAGTRAKASAGAGNGRFPCVVALHDHSGYYHAGKAKLLEADGEPAPLAELKRRRYDGRSWASCLARRGYAVLAIDALYFGTRRLDLAQVSDEALRRCRAQWSADMEEEAGIAAYNAVAGELEQLVQRHLLAAGATWPGIMLHDDRAALDYIVSRPEIDSDRIGCCGLSVGGFRSALLHAVDPRVRCAVVAGFMPSFAPLQQAHLKNHTFMIYVPGMYTHMDFPDAASLGVPKPLLVQQCRQDHLFTIASMEQAEAKLRAVYAKAGAAGALAVTWHDEPHRFSLEMQEQAFAWFDRWL